MAFIVDNVTYKYSPGTAYETTAVEDVSFKIEDGEFLGIIGHTGSGKSTLIQLLNGLLKPTSGAVYYNGQDIGEKGYDLKELRTQVGMVFQYPEHQLFESTIFEDVKFGPKNQGLSDKEASLRAYEALDTIGFPKDLFTQSPYELSGGQKRMAAIAGVLAMKPVMLILDEPTAGLDPGAKRDMLETLKRLQESTGRTIILVSHDMEEIAKYVQRILVINDGKILFDDDTRQVFSHIGELESVGLAPPEVTYLMKDLRSIGLPVPDVVLSEQEAAEAIITAMRKMHA